MRSHQDAIIHNSSVHSACMYRLQGEPSVHAEQTTKGDAVIGLYHDIKNLQPYLHCVHTAVGFLQ